MEHYCSCFQVARQNLSSFKEPAPKSMQALSDQSSSWTQACLTPEIFHLPGKVPKA